MSAQLSHAQLSSGRRQALSPLRLLDIDLVNAVRRVAIASTDHKLRHHCVTKFVAEVADMLRSFAYWPDRLE